MATSKFITHAVQDQVLDYIKTNGTELYICSGAANVADRAAAIAAKLIAVQTPAYTGPQDNAGVTARELQLNAISGVSVTASGDATQAVICSGTLLLAITTITTQTLTLGNTANIPAFKVTANDVT